MTQVNWPGTAGLPAAATRASWAEKSLQLPIAAGNGESASTTPKVFWGTGVPNGVVTAKPGDSFHATDTGATWYKQTGTGNTGWVLAGNVFDVRAFGAKGDGVTDDTAAIQAAITAAVGGVCVVPQGQYLLTATLQIPSNTVLRGQGRWIVASGTRRGTCFVRGFTGVLFNCAGADEATRKNAISLSQFTVDGQDVAGGFTGTCFDCSISTGAVLEDVEVLGNIGRWLLLAATFDAVFTRCWARRCGSLAGAIPSLDISDTAVNQTDRIAFYSLHSENQYYTHIYLHAPNAKAPKWVQFYGAKIHDWQSGANQITVPLMQVDAATTLGMYGAMFSRGLGTQLKITADESFIVGAQFLAGAGAQALEITGGQRSKFDIYIDGTTLTGQRILHSGGTGHCVFYTATGGAIPPLSNTGGTAPLVARNYDGNLQFLAGAVSAAIVPLTDAASIVSDCFKGAYFTVTIGGNRTFAAPSNPIAGMRITYTVVQDGTGGRTVAWNAVFKVSWSDTGNTPGKRSSISFRYDGTNWNQDGAQTTYV